MTVALSVFPQTLSFFFVAAKSHTKGLCNFGPIFVVEYIWIGMLLNHDGLVHNEDFLLGQHVQGELIDPLHDIRCVDAGAPQTGKLFNILLRNSVSSNVA